MYKKYPGVEPTGVKRTFGLWDTGHMVRRPAPQRTGARRLATPALPLPFGPHGPVAPAVATQRRRRCGAAWARFLCIALRDIAPGYAFMICVHCMRFRMYAP
jgi:hypothetical protein